MPNNISEYERLKDEGNEKFRVKDYEAARGLYTKAIQAKGDEPIAYLNRAACCNNLKLFYDAIEDCDRAIGLQPTLFKAFYRRAIANRELSRINSARADFAKARELDPDSRLVKDELAKVDSLLKQNGRIDVKCHEKPERLRSKKALQVFELQNHYSGSRPYDLNRV